MNTSFDAPDRDLIDQLKRSVQGKDAGEGWVAKLESSCFPGQVEAIVRKVIGFFGATPADRRQTSRFEDLLPDIERRDTVTGADPLVTAEHQGVYTGLAHVDGENAEALGDVLLPELCEPRKR